MNTAPVNGFEVWDLAYDIWVLYSTCDINNFGREDIKAEIMVWLDSRGSLLPRWLGAPIDSISANGNQFDLYSYTQGPQPYAAFVSQIPIYSSADFDLTPFITYLVDHGVFTSDDYIATVELGTEIVIGSGQLVMRNYSVTVN